MKFYSQNVFITISILILYFLSFLTSIQAAPLIMWYYYCINTTGTYTEFSMYQENLNVIISSIASSNQITGGFYNISVGSGADQVNAIGLCRGDESDSSLCLSCLSDAVYKLPQRCPTQKEAIGWYDDCMLRYSNRDIFHKMEIRPKTCLINVNNVSDVNMLNVTRARLFHTLKDQAVRSTGSNSSSPVPYFAMGQLNATNNNLTVYGMAQCTPDITPLQCSDCLDAAVRGVQNCSFGNEGGRVLTPSCGVRYESAPFFNMSRPSPHPSSSAPPHSKSAIKNNKDVKKSKTSIIVVAAVIPTVLILASIAFFCCFLRRRKSRKRAQFLDTKGGDISSIDSLQFDFATVKTLTENFSPAKRLGQGGFGAVYKGKLWDGQDIAVKRLAPNNSEQGEAEFKNEIMLLAKLQHRNLVRLLGFCLAKEERLLIYEFVPNASLDQFLFDSEKRAKLDWDKRSKIIGGIARGLLYLHEDSRLRIIHRDLKASNVLLDTEMNPKIADFGLAKLFLADQTHADTSRIAGTYGYMAPEYALHGFFSVKSDVYSFGILLLEIICGRRNRDFINGDMAISLVTLVWRNWRERTTLSIIDTLLLAEDSSLGSEIARYIHIGLLCIQENETDRPSMSSVVLMLSTDSLSLSLPTQPGYVATTIAPQDQSYSKSTGASSTNENTSTDIDAR